MHFFFFFNFSHQVYAFHTIYILQSIAERKSMSMQMISDEMHSAAIAIRQKKTQFEKW